MDTDIEFPHCEPLLAGGRVLQVHGRKRCGQFGLACGQRVGRVDPSGALKIVAAEVNSEVPVGRWRLGALSLGRPHTVRERLT